MVAAKQCILPGSQELTPPPQRKHTAGRGALQPLQPAHAMASEVAFGRGPQVAPHRKTDRVPVVRRRGPRNALGSTGDALSFVIFLRT